MISVVNWDELEMSKSQVVSLQLKVLFK
jgi:hypothetical protein